MRRLYPPQQAFRKGYVTTRLLPYICVNAFVTGFLLRLIPLLDNDSTRHMAGNALTSVTHHGGVEVRVELAKVTPGLTRVLESYPDDIVNAEHIITTISHSLGSVMTGEDTANSIKVRATLDMKRTLSAVLTVLRKPDIPRALIAHASDLLAYSTFRFSKEVLQLPSQVRFLVASLRCVDWSTRCAALGGILHIHALDSDADNGDLDPNRFVAAYQAGLPPSLDDLMVNYGVPRTDTYIRLTTLADYQKAMLQVIRDHDLCKLGILLAEYILRTEYAIGVGSFEFEDPKTGKRTTDSMGLPFIMWNDSLPHCAKALRERGELDKADILDIKYHIMKQRVDKAAQVARKSIERNPNEAYFFYAISMVANEVEGLRASKKGLKCKKISPFVRYQLMWRATEHAGWMGQKILQECGPHSESKRWEEGIAFLLSALDNAKDYVREAPPDHRHMKSMLYWYIILTITIKGPEISPDLAELDVMSRI